MNKSGLLRIDKTAAVATVSSILECYDFVIYAAMIPYVSKNFFYGASSMPFVNTLIVFAIGYLARPFGGLLFGTIGDKYGRKYTFIFTITLMALSTFAIGCLPTYDTVGVISILLLTCCRFLQGVSQGGEVPGAIIFIAEHTAANTRNKYCAFIFLGLGIGALLSSLVCYLLSTLLTDLEIIAWGWRIPFILGGFLGLISILVRKITYETLNYINQKARGLEKKPAYYLLRNCKKDLVRGVSLAVLSSSLITFTLTLPAYIENFVKLSPSLVYFIMSLGMLTMATGAPLFGILADRLSSLKLLQRSIIVCVVVIPLSIYHASNNKTFYSVLLMTITVQTCISALLGSFPILLANQFPTKVRYTGVALSYNLASLIGSLVPVIINYILLKTNNGLYVGLLFSGMGLVSLLCYTDVQMKDFLSLDEREQRIFRLR